MENESAALNVLTMGDSMSIDYGVLIAINSTSGSGNCTNRFKNGCGPREKLHFRFWPGDISPSQSSQGLMALSVMLILLCLVITYCCWGTCCKMIQKRRSRNRRSRSQASFDSSGSCASDPRLMMMWSPHHHREMCTRHAESAAVREQTRSNLLIKPRILRTEVPPPPYEALFGQEISCAPPTYSSLALNQPIYPVGSLSSENHGSAIAPSSFVTVVIEREPNVSGIQEDIQERRILRSQSVPTSIDSSSQISKNVTAVLIRTENREA